MKIMTTPITRWCGMLAACLAMIVLLPVTANAAPEQPGLAGEREIMPCDLGRIPGNRGAISGTPWTDGLVYYDFSGLISEQNRQRMRDAMDILEGVCGVLFIPRTNESNFIHVIEGGGNYSAVGMVGGSQNLSMYNWSYQFIICHELIHALGRLHQQSRADRDDYLTVNYDCIDPDYAYNYNKCEQCPTHGEYDFESVMHYSQWGFSTGCPTMTCLPPYEEYQDVMGQRDYLSDGDIASLQFMYGSPGFGACCNGGACSLATVNNCDGYWLGLDTDCEGVTCDADGILNVPSEFPTIELAMAAAANGQEVRVAPGVYTGTGAAVVDFQGKAVRVTSTNGVEATVLDGEGVRPVVLLTMMEESGAILEGFTIRNGFATIGGGIRCNGTPQIISCIIRDNVGISITGGLMSSDLTGPSLQNVTFCNNTPSNYFGNWVDKGDNTESASCAVAGICCFGEVCSSELYEYECSTTGGDWLGSDGTCVDCLGPQGACCYEEDCVATGYEGECAAGGGLWLGGGSDCDDCAVDCPGDANGDGQVSVDDLLAIITAWGQTCDGCPEDLDESGNIGVDDLLLVIGNWQVPCP
jgi:hypothetical protein